MLIKKDISISKNHCKITIELNSKNVYLTDLNSSNGTMCNDISLQPFNKHKLLVGDIILIGKCKLKSACFYILRRKK